VCPNCRDRAKIEGEPANMRCHRCNGFFEIAWNEPTRAAG
jgi:tRNA(Ile2) C34 agmatinyltransferase TiaS